MAFLWDQPTPEKDLYFFMLDIFLPFPSLPIPSHKGHMFLFLIHTLKQGGSSKNLVTCIIQENQFQVVDREQD